MKNSDRVLVIGSVKDCNQTQSIDKVLESQDTLPVNCICPWCLHELQIYDEFCDGSEFTCSSCERPVIAVEYPTEFSFIRVNYYCDALTGRQRTRLLWQKRGRR